MTAAIVRDALARRRAPGAFLVAYVGFRSRAQAVADLALTAPDGLTDLDRLQTETVPIRSSVGGLLLLARTATDLRRAASLQAILPQARYVLLIVTEPSPTTPAPAPVLNRNWQGLRDLRVRRNNGAWLVEALFSNLVPTGDFLTAVARALGGQRLGTGLPLSAGLAGAGAAHWRPGDPEAVPVAAAGPIPLHGSAPLADITLRSTSPASPQLPEWGDEQVPALTRPSPETISWQRLARDAAGGTSALLPTLAGPDAVPPVDERCVNPTGFLAAPAKGSAVLTHAGPGWAVRLGRQVVVRFPPSGCVTDAEVARLRQFRAISVEWDGHTGPIACVRVLAGLAAAGVPLFTSRVPGWARRMLGEELAELLVSTDESILADDLRREEYSIRLRRCALRVHSTRARWRGLAAAAGVPLPPPPRVSVLLCTRRPDMVGFALDQIARQRHVDLEVVLALHGILAGIPEVANAVATFEQPLTMVEAPAELPLGLVFNRAADHASGTFLAKMDDDDWYGPEHLADMLLAFDYTGADLVGCFREFMYLEPLGITVQQRAPSELLSSHVAGSSFVLGRSAFTAIGGARPVPTGGMDVQLLRTLDAAGGRIYRTHGLGYVIRRRSTGHTWQPSIGYFLRGQNRQWRGFQPSALLEPPAAAIPDTHPSSTDGRRKAGP